MPPNSHRLGLILAVVTAILFGLYPAANRAVYAAGGNLVFMVVVVTWARALTLAIYCVARRKPLFQNREDMRQALIGGVLQAFSIFAIFGALVFIPGPLVIIVVFSHTLMLLFFMAWRKEAKLDPLTVLTTVVALAGLVLVLDVWHPYSSARLEGLLLAFGAAIAAVFRLYAYGRQTRERNPAAVGAENFLAAAVFTLPALFFKAPHAPASLPGCGWLLVACVSMAAATFMMFYGISFIGAFRWSLFAKLEPVFTALFSGWFVHEVLKPYQYVGIAVVVGSLALYQVVERPRPVSAVEADAN